MRLPLIAGGLLLPLLFVLGACGNDNKSDETPTATLAGGTGTDEGYLAAICKGTSDFSNALISKTTADEIAGVIRDFIAQMKQANPPADLVQYNADFVKYLEDALSDPTSLVTRNPPLPSKDIQRRLAAKELSVEECKDGTFFSRDLDK
ncbi:MAG: hypothetical protein AB7J35_12715 [Dehalococcoidia bacterium]